MKIFIQYLFQENTIRRETPHSLTSYPLIIVNKGGRCENTVHGYHWRNFTSLLQTDIDITLTSCFQTAIVYLRVAHNHI